ncbi:hypothetical protein EDD92_9705 [Streptomyces sp. TLI_185]|nr:hypothetical protein EDD92_9705 [Streptomyces sp. TLI_185]
MKTLQPVAGNGGRNLEASPVLLQVQPWAIS